MRGDDDGFAHALQFLEDLHHLDSRPWVQTAGRFVQQQQIRVMNEHARQAQPLLHAAAQRPDERALLLAQPNQLQHVIDRLLALGLARVLIHDPNLLLLDEPASGLDPRARIEMMAILQELQRMGKTIIISSHILSELQTLCNRVAIIEKGKLIYIGPVQGVRDQMAQGRVVWVRVSSELERAIELLKTRSEVAEVATTDGEIKVTLANHDIDHSIVADVLVHGGAKLTGLREDEIGLEEVFLRVTKGDTQ